MASFFSKFFSKPKNTREDISYSAGLEAFRTGCSLSSKRQDDDAIRHFDIAIKNGVVEAYEQRGYCLQSLGFFIDSIEDFTKAIAVNPKDCNLYFCRGIARHTVGDLALAISDKHLAIEYSKLKNPVNSQRDEIAKAKGSNSLTEYYELYMALWERDLEFDIQTRDKFNKLKESGLEKDIQFANQLLATHTRIWDSNLKRR